VFGYSGAIAATINVIGSTVQAAPVRPAVAVVVEVVSTDADDTAAGAGAQAVTVVGVDENFAHVSEEVEMAGQTASTDTTAKFARVFYAYVSRSGVIHAGNQGVVTVEGPGGGAVYATIPALEGKSSMCLYTTGPKETFYIHDIHLTVDATKVVNFTLWMQRNVDDVTIPFTSVPRVIRKYTGIVSGVDLQYDPDIAIPPLTDVWMTGTATAGGGLASAEFNGFVGANIT
jgi:hypothetical protein